MIWFFRLQSPLHRFDWAATRVVRRLPYVFLFQDLFPRSAVLSGVLATKDSVLRSGLPDAMDLPKFSGHGSAQSSDGPTAAPGEPSSTLDCDPQLGH